MRFFIGIMILTFGLHSTSHANEKLEGLWKLTYLIYRQQPIPLPNPDLNLYFKFYGNGDSWLHWSRKNEPGFCQRKAIYQSTENLIYQKTVWLNPKNDSSCSNDPEMKAASETYTEYRIVNNQLLLSLDLSDEKIVYVFSFLPEETGKVITNRVNGL